ncbi:hypothetical protein DFQ26_006926 [Actinomortierella ambigua]|nr:hypothetical protein DFQ26_006926 [Actinomortierella ambigua]
MACRPVNCLPVECIEHIVSFIDDDDARTTLVPLLCVNRTFFHVVAPRIWRDPFKWLVRARYQTQAVLSFLTSVLSWSPSQESDKEALLKLLSDDTHGLQSSAPTIDYLSHITIVRHYPDLRPALERIWSAYGGPDCTGNKDQPTIDNPWTLLEIAGWAIAGHRLGSMEELILSAANTALYKSRIDELTRVRRIWFQFHDDDIQTTCSDLKHRKSALSATTFVEHFVAVHGGGGGGGDDDDGGDMDDMKRSSKPRVPDRSLDVQVVGDLLPMWPTLDRPPPLGSIFEPLARIAPLELSRRIDPLTTTSNWTRFLACPSSIDFSKIECLSTLDLDMVARRAPWPAHLSAERFFRQCRALRRLRLDLRESQIAIFDWAARERLEEQQQQQQQSPTASAMPHLQVLELVCKFREARWDVHGEPSWINAAGRKILSDAFVAFGSTLQQFRIQCVLIDLSTMRDLPRLRQVSIEATQMKLCRDTFTNCPCLEDVSLVGKGIRDRLPPPLSPTEANPVWDMPNLKRLHVEDGVFYDFNVDSLGQMPRLEELHLELQDQISRRDAWSGHRWKDWWQFPYLRTIKLLGTMPLLRMSLLGEQTTPVLETLVLQVTADFERADLMAFFLDGRASMKECPPLMTVRRLELLGNCWLTDEFLEAVLGHLFPNLQDLKTDTYLNSSQIHGLKERFPHIVIEVVKAPEQSG